MHDWYELCMFLLYFASVYPVGRFQVLTRFFIQVRLHGAFPLAHTHAAPAAMPGRESVVD